MTITKLIKTLSDGSKAVDISLHDDRDGGRVRLEAVSEKDADLLVRFLQVAIECHTTEYVELVG